MRKPSLIQCGILSFCTESHFCCGFCFWPFSSKIFLTIPLTVFLLLSSPYITRAAEGDLRGAYAYPVPFKVSESTSIRFVNLAGETSIRIFTVTGELVNSIKFRCTSGECIYDWNVKNKDGENVASGVYAYVIESATDKKTGKLVIIR